MQLVSDQPQFMSNQPLNTGDRQVTWQLLWDSMLINPFRGPIIFTVSISSKSMKKKEFDQQNWRNKSMKSIDYNAKYQRRCVGAWTGGLPRSWNSRPPSCGSTAPQSWGWECYPGHDSHWQTPAGWRGPFLSALPSGRAPAPLCKGCLETKRGVKLIQMTAQTVGFKRPGWKESNKKHKSEKYMVCWNAGVVIATVTDRYTGTVRRQQHLEFTERRTCTKGIKRVPVMAAGKETKSRCLI